MIMYFGTLKNEMAINEMRVILRFKNAPVSQTNKNNTHTHTQTDSHTNQNKKVFALFYLKMFKVNAVGCLWVRMR